MSLATDAEVRVPPAAAPPLREVPGPRGLAALRTLPALLRDPWTYTREVAARYGDVARLPVPFVDLILLSHPDEIALVNLGHQARYQRAPLVSDTMRVQGSPHHASWFEESDEDWARGRRLLQPHLTQKALAELGDLFTDAIADEVDGWRRGADTGRPFELHDPLKELALSVLYNAMFSRRIAPAEMPKLLHALDERMLATTIRTAMFALPAWVPRPKAKAGAHADAWLDEHLAEIVAQRRAQPVETADVLNVLLGAEYSDGTPLEDHKIRTEMLFLVIGGHETTAAALAWTFSLLATHPEVMRRVVAEVDALGGRAVGPGDMPQLEFTRACFDEAQRLQGGLVFNPKRAVADDDLRGFRIPAGSTVLHSNITLQRDPRFWGPDAEAFRPDRWLAGEAPAAAFQAFGRGRRMCLGKRLAYIEAVLTLASALQRYRFSAAPGWRPRHQYRMSMGVKGGVQLRLHTRRDGPVAEARAGSRSAGR
jgi:cytochrome P450